MRFHVACLCAVLLTSSAVGQEFQFANLRDVKTAFASQQRELSQVRTELASLRQEAACAAEGCDAGCASSCASACTCAGLEFGVEMTLFDLYANHGVGGTATDFFEPFDMSVDARYWIGYQGHNGYGIRARYLSYFGNPSDPDEYVDVRMIDVEGTASLSVRDWEIMFVGGPRWGRIDWSDENGDLGFRFEGPGVMIGMEVRRPIYQRLSVIGGIRSSVLLGETEPVEDAPDKANRICVPITEVRLGVEWNRPMANGASLVARAVWEHQLYSSLSGNPSSEIDPEDVDIVLAGPVFSLSYER